jgi:hypothetical protein
MVTPRPEQRVSLCTPVADEDPAAEAQIFEIAAVEDSVAPVVHPLAPRAV